MKSGSFMVYYLINANFTRVYTVQYGLDSSTVGLCYLPIAIGNVLGGIIGGQASDRLYMKRAARHPGRAFPEMRLGGIFFYGAITMQLLGFAAYGWCVQYNIHFAAGLIFLFFGKCTHNLFPFTLACREKKRKSLLLYIMGQTVSFTHCFIHYIILCILYKYSWFGTR